MRGNTGQEIDHKRALSVLNMQDYPWIPKLHDYSDTHYECEYIEGEILEEYIRRTGDVDFGLDVVQTINVFMYDLQDEFRWLKEGDRPWQEMRLCPDDIHSRNILVRNNQFYIVDLDMFGWFHSYTIFKLIQSTNLRLCDTMRSALLLYDHDRSCRIRDAKIANLERQLNDYNGQNKT